MTLKRTRIAGPAVFLLMWAVTTEVRETYFNPPQLAWFGLLFVSLTCGVTAGWLLAIGKPNIRYVPHIKLPPTLSG